MLNTFFIYICFITTIFVYTLFVDIVVNVVMIIVSIPLKFTLTILFVYIVAIFPVRLQSYHQSKTFLLFIYIIVYILFFIVLILVVC